METLGEGFACGSYCNNVGFVADGRSIGLIVENNPEFVYFRRALDPFLRDDLIGIASQYEAKDPRRTRAVIDLLMRDAHWIAEYKEPK